MSVFIYGEDKYIKAVASAREILSDKGIIITEIEIKMLIESACKEFCNKIKSEEVNVNM